jgi:hypothetical protein
LYFTWEFGLYRTLMYIAVTLAEMVIFKIIYIYKYSRIAIVNEYFLTNFVTSFNCVIIFWFTIIRLALGEHLRTRAYFQLFGKPYEVNRRVSYP